MRYVPTLVCALSLSVALAGQAQPPAPLQRLLQAELSRIPAKAGIYVKHPEDRRDGVGPAGREVQQRQRDQVSRCW